MTTRVYLGHLARDASDRDVEGLFKNYGRIREVTLKNGLVVELARGDRRREGRKDDRDGRFGPPERTEFRLIVENLAHGTSWQVR
ncbi:hypothetical protein BGZ54_002848 [Gamsiella multidivaricata]|nr:hypothetical protein BGZ54_002848 [Gamsiella multidivaricata]